MEGWFDTIGSVDWRRAGVTLLLAFALGQAVAWAYVATFRGLSYSRSNVQTLALAAIVPCMLMMAIGQSVAAALGIAGGLAIIRFRTSLRDPRDILFLFVSFGAGIACGLQSYAVAVGGVALFCLAALALHAIGFGAHQDFDGLLRFSASVADSDETAIGGVLRRRCRLFALVTLRQAAQDEVLEHAYQVTLREEDHRATLVRELQALPGVFDVTLLMQEPTLEL